jgi:hypothetical protein
VYFSTASTLSSTNYSLFNFHNVKNSGMDYFGVKVTENNSTTQILFKLERLSNNIQVGTVYNPKNGMKFTLGNYREIITSDSTNF